MRTTVIAGLFACAIGGAAGGQSAERGVEASQGQGQGQARGAGANRERLELQLRQKLARRARVELGLSQDQMTKLFDVGQRFGPRHRTLDQRENETRRALRSALLETPTGDQDRRVGQLHEQLMQLQQQRFDLIVAEQKEMSGFLTNVQRIRFEALQENFRRQIQQDLGPNGGPPPGGRRGRPPR